MGNQERGYTELLLRKESGISLMSTVSSVTRTLTLPPFPGSSTRMNLRFLASGMSPKRVVRSSSSNLDRAAIGCELDIGARASGIIGGIEAPFMEGFGG